MTGDMVTVTLPREQWRVVTLALGDGVRVHVDESRAADNETDRERSRRHADAVRAVWDIIADTLAGTE